MTSGDLAARIAPALAAALEARRTEIIQAAGGGLARLGLKAAWPILQRELPHLAAVAVDATRAEFGALSVSDLLDWLGSAHDDR